MKLLICGIYKICTNKLVQNKKRVTNVENGLMVMDTGIKWGDRLLKWLSGKESAFP